MSILFHRFLIIVSFIVSCTDLSAQYNWKMTTNKDGIKVYESENKNSNYKSIKVECTLPGTLDKLMAVLNNVNLLKEWVYNNKTAYLLKRISPFEFYYYSETYLPWPMSNRDAAMHMRMTKDSLNRFLKVTAVGVPNYIPEKDGKVRIKKSLISWFVTMPSPRTIHIVYVFEADPGGSLPAWLVNMFADKGPYESFKKLGEVLSR